MFLRNRKNRDTADPSVTVKLCCCHEAIPMKGMPNTTSGLKKQP